MAMSEPVAHSQNVQVPTAALHGPERDGPADADHRDVLGVGASDPVDRAEGPKAYVTIKAAMPFSRA